MEEFKQEDYIMPEVSTVPLEEQQTKEGNLVAEKTIEQIQKEIEQEKAFFETIDISFQKNDFQGEITYIEKLKELEREKENQDINKILENKIYYQKILNLIESHKKALDVIAQKEEQYKPGDAISLGELRKKSDEISERKIVLDKHLYFLRNYIEENKKVSEPESYAEIPKELKELVIQGIENLNNPEAFKKLKNLGIENPEEFIDFLKSIEITNDEEEDTHIKPWTNTPEEQFDVYCINLKPSNDGIHGKNIKHDIAHEFGHVIQKYLKEKKLPQITNLDKKTLELIPHMNSSLPYFENIISDENISFEKRNNIKYIGELKTRYPKLFESEILSNEEKIAKDLLYFINGSGGLERLAFLRETRQELFNNGIINSFQEEITPAKLQQLSSFEDSNRILSFLNKDVETLKILTELLNTTP